MTAGERAEVVRRRDMRLAVLVGLAATAAQLAVPLFPLGGQAARSLLFSDIPANSIHEWKPGGPPRLFMRRSGQGFDDPARELRGVHVLAADGAHLGSIELPVAVSNVGWGDDGSTLCVTASTAVHRIWLGTHGVGF